MGTQEGEGKILDLGENSWATTYAKRESSNFYENPNANTDWTVTWRLKTSTRVIDIRAQTDVWPFTLKKQMKYFSLTEKVN